MSEGPTKRECQIIRLCSRKWVMEAAIGSRVSFLQELYHKGWLDGAFFQNLGRTPYDRQWRATPEGLNAAGITIPEQEDTRIAS